MGENVAAFAGRTRLLLVITELKLAEHVALCAATAADLAASPDGATCFLTGAPLTPGEAWVLTLRPCATKLEEAGNPGGVARREVVLTRAAAAAAAGLTLLINWTDIVGATMDEYAHGTPEYITKRRRGTLDGFQWGAAISSWIGADWDALVDGALRPARRNQNAIWSRYARWRSVADGCVRRFMCAHGKCMCPDAVRVKDACPVPHAGNLLLQIN